MRYNSWGSNIGPRDGTPPPKASLKDVSIMRIVQLFRPYWGRLLVILFLALTGAVIGLAPPLVMREIIDIAIPNKDMGMLGWLAALMVGLPVISGLLSVWQNYQNTRVGQSVMRDLRGSLFANLQRQSMSFFTDARSGEIIQRLTGDVQAVQGVVTTLVVSAVTQSVILITTLIILFALDVKLAILSTVILPLFVLPVRKVATMRKRIRGEAQKIRGDMASRLGEVFGISGALLTRIFGREKDQEQEFEGLNSKVMELELRLDLVGRWFGMFLTLLAPLGTALIYMYGGYSVINGDMTIGEIVAFTAYVSRLYNPVSTLLNLHVEATTALGIFRRLFDYLDKVPEVQDAPGAAELKAVKGHVEFKEVSFAYQPGHDVLQDITFDAKPGQVVALVGPSGAGKSTLVGMLSRLYDPTGGSIAIDGVDVSKVTLDSLRAQMAYVTQESFLFHATVRENLRFARSDATEEELMDACRKAYIYDSIMALPQGFDTVVGERGHRLSGGERQRLAIARAILKDPRILILDEATSHLDSESEAYVQAALDELMKHRTTLVIAHRLSTILAANSILVLEDGRIAEFGKHEELLERDGLYARLYRTQYGNETKPGRE